ncbi:MAG: AI-2E family transporter [Oscillospiraceae bacterium]|nr:AI-2E family transporter [Oscillospiraceae bacterium]MDD4546341.1 AI-2E family transporter [Oscillospiraceae bacterium]
MKDHLKGFTRLISLFVLGVALIAVYKTFDNMNIIVSFIGKIFAVLSPFVIGLGLAFLLYAPSSRLENLLARNKYRLVSRNSRIISVLLVYLTLFLIIALLLTFALPAIIKGLVDFVSSLPYYYSQLMIYLNKTAQNGGLLQGLDISDTIENIYTSYIQPQLSSEAVISYFKGVMNFTSSLLSVFMAFIISVYMLISREPLINTGKLVLGIFLNDGQMSRLSHYTHRSCDILYSYFYSQVLDAIIVGVIITVGLFIFRAPNAPLLGFLIGLLNMIPYFGAIMGGGIAVAITLLSGNPYGAIFIAIYIVVMQQVDANLIQPRIVGHTLGVRPIYVLLAITLGGGLFGFWGIFLGVPAIAIIQMLLRDYLNYRHRLKKPTIPPSGWNNP